MLARLMFRLAVAETAMARTQVPLLELSRRLSTRICLHSSTVIPQGIIIKEEVGFLRRIRGLIGPIAEWGSKEGTSLWVQKKAFPHQR
jgi:hypothetical protein